MRPSISGRCPSIGTRTSKSTTTVATPSIYAFPPRHVMMHRAYSLDLAESWHRFPLGVGVNGTCLSLAHAIFPVCLSFVLVRLPFHSHRLGPLLYAHCPCSHFDRSQLFDTVFFTCNPLLYNNMMTTHCYHVVGFCPSGKRPQIGRAHV